MVRAKNRHNASGRIGTSMGEKRLLPYSRQLLGVAGRLEKSSPHLERMNEFHCVRCLRTYGKLGHINPMTGTCRNTTICDRELLLLQQEWGKEETSQIDQQSPVASPVDPAHNAHSTQGGPVVSLSEFDTRVAKARRMIRDGASQQALMQATGFGSGTISRMKKNPDYAPNERISEIRKKQWASGARGPKTGQSLRQRIVRHLAALPESRYLDSIDELRSRISRPGENVDLHNVTHLLEGLRQQGIVKFDHPGKGSSSARITNIRITKYGRRFVAKAAGEAPVNGKEIIASGAPAPAPAPAAPAPTPSLQLPLRTPEPATPAQEEQVAAAEPTTTSWSEVKREKFPLLRSLVLRGAKVRTAVSLLREAGMEEEASLIEGQLVYTPLEQEIIELLRDKGIVP